MSPNPNMGADPGATPPAAAPPAADGQPVDWQAKYQAEVQDRIRERERYKPVSQTFSRLDQGTAQAIMSLAEAAAEGDMDYIATWAEETHRNLTGSEIAARVAAQQGATGGMQPAPTAPATPPASAPAMTPEQIAAMVRAETEQAMRRNEMIQQINGELATAGYPVGTPAAQAILAYAQQTRLPIPDAVAWYNADLQQQFQRYQQGLTGAAGQMPPPAPNGNPAAPLTGASPRDRAIARLAGGQSA